MAQSNKTRTSKRQDRKQKEPDPAGIQPHAIVLHGHIITMDPVRPRASSLLVSDGKIVAFDAAATEAARSLGAVSIDLGTRTVIPGLTDAHHHMAQSAAQGAWVEVSPRKCPTTQDIFETLQNAPRTSWVIAWGMDEQLQGGVLTRRELTEAVPDRPCVVVHSSYHHCWANDLALEYAGIDESTRDPEGGKIDRDRSGKPTGILFDSAMTMVFAPAQRAALEDPMLDWAGLVRAHQERMLSYGFTYLCDACAPPEFEELYRNLARSGDIKIPMTVCPTGADGFFVLPSDRLDGAPTGEREGPLVLGPLKIFMDGATRCAVELRAMGTLRAAAREAVRGLRSRNLATVAMLADTTVPLRLHGRNLLRGELFVSEEEFAKFVQQASQRGFGIITHALGNRAARAVMRAYDRIDKPVGVPRLEHVTIADRLLIQQLSASGYGIATQPGFISLFPWLAHLPVPGEVVVLPVRSLVENGAFLAFSTDQPSGEPDPWVGLACAVSRSTTDGDEVSPEERVGPETALALFTREAAKLSGYDGGILKENGPADFVVLDGDPLADEALAKIKVRPCMTFIGGKPVWHKSDDVWVENFLKASRSPS
jgi:predicted amidohydrolase YtcJ